MSNVRKGACKNITLTRQEKKNKIYIVEDELISKNVID